MTSRTALHHYWLNDQEIRVLMRPMLGTGGFNTMVRHLQRIIQPDGKISLTDCEVGEILRIAGYGSGGVEGRMRVAFGRHLTAPFAARGPSDDAEQPQHEK